MSLEVQMWGMGRAANDARSLNSTETFFFSLTTGQKSNCVGGRTTKVIAFRVLVKIYSTWEKGTERKPLYLKKKQNSIGYRLQLEEDEGTSLRHCACQKTEA